MIIKLLGSILSLLFILIFPFCPDPPEPPAETPIDGHNCGEGTGSYYSTVEGLVPSDFDANTQGNFTISFNTTIDNSYNTDPDRFNRLYFELEKDFEVYRSNYVEFKSDNTNSQELEWGGSLASGEYEITAFMKNIQLDSSCPDSVYKEEQYYLGDINITQYSNPQKVMVIEYFCQQSDTAIIPRYDVFLSPNTEEFMDIAFNIANTRDSVITYWTDLPPQLIEFDPNDPSGSVDYIFTYKQWDDEMFLCGIKGFKDTQGNPIDMAGNTILTDTLDFTPSCYSGSLVAVKSIIDMSAPFYNVDYNDILTATAIHELGHQRAIHQHHDNFGSPPERFCIMNRHLIYSSQFNLYSNPHFCDDCINKIRNINW
jgi:hypothetical protein